MPNYTAMKTFYTTNNKEVSSSYTCKKDSTAIVMFLGQTYLGYGNVKLNGTVLTSCSGSTAPKYMQILDMKQGDVIKFTFQTGATNGYRLFGIIIHEDGAF